MPPNIAEAIEQDVCTACGVCEVVCPIGACKEQFDRFRRAPDGWLELAEKLIETKRKNNVKHFAEVCGKFSLKTGIRNETN